MESQTKIYDTLLDVQRQIGEVSRETGQQTEKLISIEAQVIKANGRTLSLEKSVSALQLANATDSGASSVRTALWAALGGIILTIVASIILKQLGL